MARGRSDMIRTIDGHHVIPQRHLKRAGLEEHLWDERNGLALCRWHHFQHENHRERLPRELIPDEAHDFALELGLDWLIDREYPA